MSSFAKKPYQAVPIQECNEPLVIIPAPTFSFIIPHPYVRVAAPYGDKSPHYLRQGVLERLLLAQRSLQGQYPGWRIHIFDAYRPLAVQQYMVDYTFQQVVGDRGLRVEQLTATERQEILEQVYQFWAAPSPDPATPPPHSTGAAVDVTLVDANGAEIDMGSPIDELSPRSYPDYFKDNPTLHQHRQILRQVMITAGFCQHPREWWHFSYGDQLWAWLCQQENPQCKAIARYGAVA